MEHETSCVDLILAKYVVEGPCDGFRQVARYLLDDALHIQIQYDQILEIYNTDKISAIFASFWFAAFTCLLIEIILNEKLILLLLVVAIV